MESYELIPGEVYSLKKDDSHIIFYVKEIRNESIFVTAWGSVLKNTWHNTGGFLSSKSEITELSEEELKWLQKYEKR